MAFAELCLLSENARQLRNAVIWRKADQVSSQIHDTNGANNSHPLGGLGTASMRRFACPEAVE